VNGPKCPAVCDYLPGPVGFVLNPVIYFESHAFLYLVSSAMASANLESRA
jgi:hypothetical protein